MDFILVTCLFSVGCLGAAAFGEGVCRPQSVIQCRVHQSSMGSGLEGIESYDNGRDGSEERQVH